MWYTVIFAPMDIPFDFVQVEVRRLVLSSLDVDGITREKAAGSKVVPDLLYLDCRLIRHVSYIRSKHKV